MLIAKLASLNPTEKSQLPNPTSRNQLIKERDDILELLKQTTEPTECANVSERLRGVNVRIKELEKSRTADPAPVEYSAKDIKAAMNRISDLENRIQTQSKRLAQAQRSS